MLQYNNFKTYKIRKAFITQRCMCGIIGIHDTRINQKIPYDIFEGLISLQHRGQDSTGIANQTRMIKKEGLVKNSFNYEELDTLISNCGIGHVRYTTNGTKDGCQPLYCPFPRRITLCHNGNITNVEEIRNILRQDFGMITNSQSDSQLLLYLYSSKLYQFLIKNNHNLNANILENVSNYIHDTVCGSFCITLIIEHYGMIVIRDKNGIRPLIWGGSNTYTIICSESAALNILGYEILRDVAPGETIIFENNGRIFTFRNEYAMATPCLFEYIYFARSDSTIDKINVLEARIIMGNLLGKKIKRLFESNEGLDIDVIVPVPDTSVTFVNGIQDILQKPMRHGLIKNRYIDRTFIMKSCQTIKTNIKRKITGNNKVFKDKSVLIVDDSIVRGNTSKHIVNLVRRYNARKIYFASCSPVVRNTNVYGINIPTREELISFQSSENDIRDYLGVDYLIYNDLDDIVCELKKMNTTLDGFEISMFKP